MKHTIFTSFIAMSLAACLCVPSLFAASPQDDDDDNPAVFKNMPNMNGMGNLPSEQELTTWESRLRPGYYHVEEYDVGAKGRVSAKTDRTYDTCMTPATLKLTARSPIWASDMWQCIQKPQKIMFSNLMFETAVVCSKTAESLISGSFNVTVSPDKKTITTTILKYQASDDNPLDKKIIYGKGSASTWQSECDATGKPVVKGKQETAAATTDNTTSPPASIDKTVTTCKAGITGDQEASYQICKKALATLKDKKGTPDEVEVLLKLGLMTGYVHEDEQLGYYLKASESAEKAYGATSQKLLAPLVNLGLIYKNKKDYPNAIKYLQKAIDIGIESPDQKDKVDTVQRMEYLIRAMEEVPGMEQEALMTGRVYVMYAENTLGLNHEDTASAYTTAGILEMKAGNLENARVYVEKSLKIWQATPKSDAYVRGAKEKLAKINDLLKKQKSK